MTDPAARFPYCRDLDPANWPDEEAEPEETRKEDRSHFDDTSAMERSIFNQL